jgi:hypothetical protein
MRMQGYRLNDQDTKAMVHWLAQYHPENANRDYAEAMLIEMKLAYRQIGWSDPDKLEDFYREFSQKLSDQNGKTSDE